MTPLSRTIVFDVNETLLDLSPLESQFEAWFGDGRVMREWFAQLVLYSQSLTLAGRYVDFAEIAVAVLGMVARIHDRELPDGAAETLKSTIGSLPAHSDVESALSQLRDAGYRLVTLTNSGAEAQRRQLDRAGIAHLFDAQFSVEAVRAFKPALSTYASVAAALNERPTDMIMIACHAWDIIGARAAGLETGFVARAGNAEPDLAETRAIYAAASLDVLAAQIIG
jgi:2-haloacid dehalogenase